MSRTCGSLTNRQIAQVACGNYHSVVLTKGKYNYTPCFLKQITEEFMVIEPKYEHGHLRLLCHFYAASALCNTSFWAENGCTH